MSVPVPLSDAPVGLEDYDPRTDAVTPRLTIDHRNAVFVNGLTGERWPKLEVVILGLVKQRVLWPPTITDDNEPPLCKSYEFVWGHPIHDFPWDKSGFDAKDYTDDRPLPCESCALREWGSHPTAPTPWCSEQHTFVLMLPTGDDWTPALFSVQRTGIKPSRTYISGFKQSNSPLFIVTTNLSLQENKRGLNEYCVPVFTRGKPTDQDEWQSYADTYRNIRAFLQSPRELNGDEAVAPRPSDSAAAGRGATQNPAPVASGSQTSVATGAGRLAKDDDIPF